MTFYIKFYVSWGLWDDLFDDLAIRDPWEYLAKFYETCSMCKPSGAHYTWINFGHLMWGYSEKIGVILEAFNQYGLTSKESSETFFTDPRGFSMSVTYSKSPPSTDQAPSSCTSSFNASGFPGSPFISAFEATSDAKRSFWMISLILFALSTMAHTMIGLPYALW